MFTVEKFLCCFELEKAGMIVGWLGLVSYIPPALTLTFIAAYFIFFSQCDDIMLPENLNIQLSCGDLTFAIVMILLFVISVLLALIYIKIQLISGSRELIPNKILPGLFLIATKTYVLFFLTLIFLALHTAMAAFLLTMFIFNAHCTICIYSLYLKACIEDNNRNGFLQSGNEVSYSHKGYEHPQEEF